MSRREDTVHHSVVEGLQSNVYAQTKGGSQYASIVLGGRTWFRSKNCSKTGIAGYSDHGKLVEICMTAVWSRGVVGIVGRQYVVLSQYVVWARTTAIGWRAVDGDLTGKVNTSEELGLQSIIPGHASYLKTSYDTKPIPDNRYVMQQQSPEIVTSSRAMRRDVHGVTGVVYLDKIDRGKSIGCVGACTTANPIAKARSRPYRDAIHAVGLEYIACRTSIRRLGACMMARGKSNVMDSGFFKTNVKLFAYPTAYPAGPFLQQRSPEINTSSPSMYDNKSKSIV
ncbi:hypothetical protein B0H34DRAFT_673458 [Crassisporium funariophilum]|nr:hypothetical protein B0H34DRAFT_673458 [Crassisporium funariophilum]